MAMLAVQTYEKNRVIGCCAVEFVRRHEDSKCAVTEPAGYERIAARSFIKPFLLTQAATNFSMPLRFPNAAAGDAVGNVRSGYRLSTYRLL